MLSNIGASATVLVVEDSVDTRQLFRVMLEMQGYRVVEAEDGEQAVEVAAQESPALILMDLNLPLLSGLEATRQIHRQAAMHDVPIVAVSAQCRGEYVQMALDAGCLECIQKPVDFVVMNEVVSRYMPH